MNVDILIRCLISMVCGWFIGFFYTRRVLKDKYSKPNLQPEGILKLVYDKDDPEHPPMGLELESLGYILSHEFVMLKIVKYGFPDVNKKVYLENKKDKSA